MVNNYPAITAIVPNYNHGIFLVERLSSVYGQSYPNLKVLLLDDASTDNSKEILEHYRHHPRTQALVLNTQNSGSPFPQWQKGIEMAETEWVWIAESDDTCDQGFLEALLPGLQNFDCVLAFNELHWINEQGKITRQAVSRAPQWWDGDAFVQTALLPRNRLLNSGMAVIRRRAAIAANHRWAHYRKSGDYRLFAEVARQGKVYGSGQKLASFRRHPDQVTTKMKSHELAFKEKFETWQYLLDLGTIRPDHLHKVVRMRLVDNEVAKNGRGKAEYGRVKQYWMGFARQIGYGITDFEVKRLALWVKVKHRLRR